MSDVDSYYEGRVDKSSDLYWQVGKTVAGKPVGEGQLDKIVSRIASALRLERTDGVLDLGCGNGLVTFEIAKKAKHVTGVEKSGPLYRTALERSAAANVSYLNASLFEVDFAGIDFNKAYMYEVIQHLEYRQLPRLLNALFGSGKICTRLFVGGIPDEEQKWKFYDSKERRCGQLEALLNSGDPVGTWFHKDHIVCLGESLGLRVMIMPQGQDLYTSHYRFDCVFEAK